jgi:hypothetical protein
VALVAKWLLDCNTCHSPLYGRYRHVGLAVAVVIGGNGMSVLIPHGNVQ